MIFDFNNHPFTSKLQNVKKTGDNQYIASCPCSRNHKHGDKKQSLSVKYDQATRHLLIHCHTGCTENEILESVGCSWNDLFVNDGSVDKLKNTISWYCNNKKLKFVDIYNYSYPPFTDELYKVRFIDSDGKKSFAWVHADNNKRFGYTWNKEGLPSRLFVAGDLSGDTVIITEGEKDAITTHNLTGFTAVSAENGATKADSARTASKKWSEAYNDQLEGKSVLILFDQDETGKVFADIEATKLIESGKPSSVCLLDIGMVWPDCPEGGDITDLVDKAGADKAKELLLTLVCNATPYTPRPSTTKTEVIEGITVTTTGKTPQKDKEEELPVEEIAKRITKKLSDITRVEKRYIYKPYFPVGKFSIISSDPGVGKTKLVCALSALITTGSPLLGVKCEKPGNVVIFSREDGATDILETIESCGGDTTKVTVLDDDSEEALSLMSKHPLTFDSPIIEEIIKTNNPSLVVFDPYQKYLGHKVDMNRANELSQALTPLTVLSKKYDCNILVLSHNTKAQTGLQYKFMGSVDFVGEARSAFTVVRDPERTAEQENIIIPVKTNNKLGKAIRYKIESIEGKEDYATVKWLGLEEYTESDFAKANRRLLIEDDKENNPRTTDNPVVRTILCLMKDNPEGVAVSYDDFQTVMTKYTGSLIDIKYEKAIRAISSWMNTEFGIGVVTSAAQPLKAFYCNGEAFVPTKYSARRIVIRRNRVVDQQQQKIME